MVRKCNVIIPPYFFHFSKFWFFRLLGGKRAKKWYKMVKNYVCRTPYLRKHILYEMIFGTHVWNDGICRWFSGLLGVKREKSDPKWQKILSRSVTQLPYLIWLWFLIHMMISLAFFFSFFQNSDFLVRGVGVAVFHFLYLNNCRSCQDFW